MYRAQTGRLRGNETDPVERTATAGLATFKVAPWGYRKVTLDAAEPPIPPAVGKTYPFM